MTNLARPMFCELYLTTLVEEQILWLQVSVNDVSFMYMLERKDHSSTVELRMFLAAVESLSVVSRVQLASNRVRCPFQLASACCPLLCVLCCEKHTRVDDVSSVCVEYLSQHSGVCIGRVHVTDTPPQALFVLIAKNWVNSSDLSLLAHMITRNHEQPNKTKIPSVFPVAFDERRLPGLAGTLNWKHLHTVTNVSTQLPRLDRVQC